MQSNKRRKGALDRYGTPLLDCPNQSCSGVIGGNTDLKPEVAVTRSIGIVLTPDFAEGLSATIDYFDIKIANVIDVLPQAIVLEACGISGSPFLCSLIHRAPGTGLLYGRSGYIDSLNRNSGSLQSEGIDFEANYETYLSTLGLGQRGSLSLNLLGTLIQRHVIEPVPVNVLKHVV